jgi:asparagine synthetase B (glutamine-hydrolysing)
VERAFAEVQGFRAPDGFESWDRFHQLLYVEAKTRLPSFINLGLDASSMSHSIEPRLPFLDHEFVELCTRVPAHLRNKTKEKHILRKAMGPHLPAEIAWRDKRGLSAPDPLWRKEWGPAPDFVDDLLSDRVVSEKGYFDPDAVGPLLAGRPGSGLGRSLAAIVGFHMWDEHFVQGVPSERIARKLPRRRQTSEASL